MVFEEILTIDERRSAHIAMSSPVTMVFIDLADSTAAYAELGNAQVADVVSKVTHWIGRVCEAHHGRIVKNLGDGVLGIFGDAASAVSATAAMLRGHQERANRWPQPVRMDIRVGVASVGNRVVYLLNNPSKSYDLGQRSFASLMIRAAQRASHAR